MNLWEVLGIILGIIGSILLYITHIMNVIIPNGMNITTIVSVISLIFIWISGLLLGAENLHS